MIKKSTDLVGKRECSGTIPERCSMTIDLTRIQAICFDVDGTLSDTDDLYVEKLVRIIKPFQFLLPARDASRLARRIIMEVEAPGNYLIGLMDSIGFDDEIYALVDHMARRNHNRTRETRIIPGVREMLGKLTHQYPLAVVSARDEHTTMSFLDSFELTTFFQCIATAQTCAHTKPFPDPILWAAQQMRVSPHACLMVGDTTVDISAGKKAGAQTAGVLCGFGEREELERKEAGIILQTTADLPEVLKPGMA
jgi:HAD superfamily hydrolase (TIGR01549 family)